MKWHCEMVVVYGLLWRNIHQSPDPPTGWLPESFFLFFIVCSLEWMQILPRRALFALMLIMPECGHLYPLPASVAYLAGCFGC